MTTFTGALVLDSEGVRRGAALDREVLATLEAAAQDHHEVVVSAVTLAEVLRGHPRDAGVHRLLKSCRVAPVSARIGRRAGEILGRTKRDDTVDAVVAATAATQPYPAVILTGDPGDLLALTEELPGVGVAVV